MSTNPDTRPLAERITQGPVTFRDCGRLNKDYRAVIQTANGAFDILGPPCMQEVKHNAELIAEAFNTTHETGRTPHQLADEREELIGALSAINAHWTAGNFSRDESLWEPMRKILARCQS